MCRSLVNTAPNLSGSGERIRRGYTAYTAVTAPTGAQILQVAPVQVPSQQDVHIWFATSGVYQNPYWFGPTIQNSNILVNEHFGTAGTPFDPANTDVSFPTQSSMKINNLATTGNATAVGFTSGIVAIADYFRNFGIYNVTQQTYALVTGYSISSGNGTFTLNERIDLTALNWQTSDTFIFFRNDHSNYTFAPTYNTTLIDPPCVNADKSVIRWSGGQGSAGGLMPMISQYISRTFFPNSTGRQFTFAGTYITERRLKPVDVLAAAPPFTTLKITVPAATASDALLDNKTYWIAVAPVYDGFQIGELQTYEDTTQYDTGSNANGNYIATSGAFSFIMPIVLRAGSFDKRITGFIIYMAQDTGDTRTTGRVAQYFSIKFVSLTTTQTHWTYTNAAGYYAINTSIRASEWAAKANDYTTDSGIVEVPTDTMYPYSDELILGTRRLLTNVYVTSEAVPNRQEIFTNPIGGNADVNAGLTSIDLFSNEDGFYRLRAEPTIGTKINGMRPTGLEDVIVLKDRGVLHGRLIVVDDIPDFIWSIISHDIGCATLRGHSFSDDAWIYFAGYDDIYRYRNGQFQRLIEDPESENDWLYTYREILSKTVKESTCCFYLPERQVFFDIGQAAYSTGKQVSYYPDYGWREVALKQSTVAQANPPATAFIKWTTRLQNGTVLVIDSSGNVYQWSNPTTGAFYKDDNGTAIIPYIDTGSFIPSGDEAFDFVLNYIGLSRTFDSVGTGSLDIDLYKDGTLLRSYTAQDNSSKFLPINSVVSDARQGNQWRMVYNTNATNPEHLLAGTILTLNKMFWYGELRKRSKRATEHSAGQSITPLGGCVSGTIGGKQEVTVNKTDTPFVWDSPFTKTYTGVEGSVPTYRFKMQPAYVIGSDQSTVETITIVSQTLTGITLRSSSDSTLVKFEATE